MEAILHGILLSFGLILPLGVQNLFVFSQGATQPKLIRALPATITAALCDTLLILLAVFGISVIVFQVHWLKTGLMIVGAIFLIYIGYTIWKSKTKMNETNQAVPVRQQILFAMSVSLLNPHAILDTVGVIGTNAVKYNGVAQLYFTIACISVSWVWFFGLTIAGATIKKLEVSGNLMNIINKCSALFIWGTAIYLIIGIM